MLLVFLFGADPQVKPLSVGELNRLVTLRENIELLQKLDTNGVQVDKDKSVMNSLLSEAKMVGGVSDYAELVNITGGANGLPTTVRQASNLLTFANVLAVIGSLMVASTVLFLFGHYFIDMIRAVPVGAWEVILWLSAVAFGFSTASVSSVWQLLPLMLACFFSMSAVGLGVVSRKMPMTKRCEVAFSVLAVFWGVLAIVFGNHVIGFMSIMAVLSALGFVFGHLPGVSYIGFEKQDVISQATIAAGSILGLHVLLVLTGSNAPIIDVFREGMSFMGSTVYFVGILIMSSKFYSNTSSYVHKINWPMYWSMQIVTIVSGLLALYVGTVFGISTLSGIGGTFFCMYIIEKYYDIPWKGVGYIWSFLGFGLLVYGMSTVVKNYPQYFLFG